MSQEINLGGTIYISSRRGAEITGYSQDYVGQLARSGSIDARRVSGLWYVLESSLLSHKEKAEDFVPTPPQKMRELENEISVSFDGKDYISASRASEISGYSKDYVTQLAREGKVDAHQSSNRWYIDQESLIQHKREKDSLLAAVQSESVGIRDGGDIMDKRPEIEDKIHPHFTYTKEYSKELLPIQKSGFRHEDRHVDEYIPTETTEIQNSIPIRIVNDVSEEISSKNSGEIYKGALKAFKVLSLFGGLIATGFLILYGIKFSSLELNVRILVPEFVKSLIGKELVFSRKLDF